MLVLVGVELTKFVRDIRRQELVLMALTVGLSLLTNMAIGFVTAVFAYHVLRRWKLAQRYVG